MGCTDRWFLMAALPAALAFVACGSSSTTRPQGAVDASPGDSPSADLAVGMATLTVNPPSVDPGCVDVGVTSSPVMVTVTNVADVASGPLTVTVSGKGISTTGCEGTVLAPKTSCTISVTTKLTEPGPLSGTIEVGDTPAHTKKISVSATCYGRPGGITLSPAPLDLGTVPAGKSVSGTIVLTNLAPGDLTSIAVAVSGDGFSLSPTGTCTATLAPNQFCKIEVTFTAGTTAGPARGTVTVGQGGVTKPVAVTATVVAPPEQADAGALDLASGDVAQGSDTLGSDVLPGSGVSIDPKTLEFGRLAISQESPPQTLTFSNSGAAPTGVLKVDKVGAEFAIEGDTCTGTSLTPSGTSRICTITVTYTPVTQPSEDTGSITVTDVTGAAGAATATLHGQGTLPPALILSPSSVCPESEADDPLCTPSTSTSRFSNMPIGQAAPELSFVLTNVTDPTDTPDSGELSFTLEGAGAADFAVTSNTCRAPLISTDDTPSTCSVTLTFTPAASGLRKAILKVTTSRGGSARAILEGKGLT